MLHCSHNVKAPMNALFLHTDFLNLLQLLIPIAAIIAMFFLFVILPQRYLKQQQQQLLKKVNRGTRIKTIHGIWGTVYSCTDNFIIIERDDGRKIEILRQTIASVIHEKP